MIVNPNSGPGAGGSQPDFNYQGCVTQLKAYSNVKTVGYVLTGYGSRGQSAVNTDVATYAGWAASYRPDGIFFAEVKTTSGMLPQYTAYANTVKSSFYDSARLVSANIPFETVSWD